MKEDMESVKTSVQLWPIYLLPYIVMAWIVMALKGRQERQDVDTVITVYSYDTVITIRAITI